MTSQRYPPPPGPVQPALPGEAKRSPVKTLLVPALWVFLAAIVLAEAGGRYILGLGDSILVQPDPYAGYVLKPNQHVYRFFHHADINAYSMRSPAFSLDKPVGTYRVLMLGDSMTYGTTQLDQQAIFSSLLQAELPAQMHQPVEVLNGSAGAWAIGNELGYLESRGTFHSDLVVLMLNTGDSLQPPATLADLGGDAATVKPACALCEVWTRYLRDKLLHRAPKRDAGTAPTPDEMANAAPNLQRLVRFYNDTRQQHVPMAIVFMAMRAYVPQGAQQSAPGKLVEWAQQNHVPLIDTTKVESPFTVRQITLDGLHFNARGHRVVATYLEQHWNEIDPGRLTAGKPSD